MNKLSFFERVNERNFEKTLSNIKMIVETGWFNLKLKRRNPRRRKGPLYDPVKIKNEKSIALFWS